MSEPKVDKNAIFISFYSGDTLIREYIPPPISKYELKAREKYRRLQNKLNVPHYYWHYRHLLNPEDRKIEDLKFFIHVYEDHGGTPIDDYEKKYYKRVCSLYAKEFNELIQPKLDLENEGKGITHLYAKAYYKKWLRDKNGNLTRLYHGVDTYEILEMYDELIANINQEMKKKISSKKYHDNVAKKNKTKKKNYATERKMYNEQRKEKFKLFKKYFIYVDFLLSLLIATSYAATSVKGRSLTENIFSIMAYIVLLQIPLLFIYLFAIDNFFSNLDD